MTFEKYLLFYNKFILQIKKRHAIKKIYKYLEDNCFVVANVKSLYRMGTYAFVIAGIKIFRCFVYFTTAAVVIAGVFLFAGLFSKVLARVFDRAVKYKLENDLTI